MSYCHHWADQETFSGGHRGLFGSLVLFVTYSLTRNLCPSTVWEILNGDFKEDQVAEQCSVQRCPAGEEVANNSHANPLKSAFTSSSRSFAWLAHSGTFFSRLTCISASCREQKIRHGLSADACRSSCKSSESNCPAEGCGGQGATTVRHTVFKRCKFAITFHSLKGNSWVGRG